MLPTKTFTYTRDEIVELVCFKSLEKGHDPDDVFRNFIAGDLRHFGRLMDDGTPRDSGAASESTGRGGCPRRAMPDVNPGGAVPYSNAAAAGAPRRSSARSSRRAQAGQRALPASRPR